MIPVLNSYEIGFKHTTVEAVDVCSLHCPSSARLRERLIDDMRLTEFCGVILEQDRTIEVRERTPGYGFVVGTQFIEFPLYGRGHFAHVIVPEIVPRPWSGAPLVSLSGL